MLLVLVLPPVRVRHRLQPWDIGIGQSGSRYGPQIDFASFTRGKCLGVISVWRAQHGIMQPSYVTQPHRGTVRAWRLYSTCVQDFWPDTYRWRHVWRTLRTVDHTSSNLQPLICLECPSAQRAVRQTSWLFVKSVHFRSLVPYLHSYQEPEVPIVPWNQNILVAGTPSHSDTARTSPQDPEQRTQEHWWYPCDFLS